MLVENQEPDPDMSLECIRVWSARSDMLVLSREWIDGGKCTCSELSSHHSDHCTIAPLYTSTHTCFFQGQYYNITQILLGLGCKGNTLIGFHSRMQFTQSPI